ncbi:MAG: alkaline phosphatase family protein [Proteobacteria bacterium]|nr:alkaline phosphatase family protein [Pseudomonadota bacterium]
MQSTNATDRKILVIGIDGGTFDVIMPMIEAGLLPNLGKLVRNGIRSELLSTIPPVTSPAWSSFITGTNPGRHGVFGFFDRDLANYELNSVNTLMNLTNMKGIPFWRAFNRYGKKVGLINIPLTYPPDKVDGFMISGMLVPENAKDYFHPAEIRSDLDGYQVDLQGLRDNNNWNARNLVMADRDGYIRKVFKMTESRAHHALKFMKNKEWDFFMVVFTGSDRICHHFWTDNETGEAPSPLVKKYYRFLDEKIGSLIEGSGEKTVKIMMSDHGFGKAPEKSINAFALMKNLGYPAVGLNEKFRFLANKITQKMGLPRNKVELDESYWRKSKVFPVPIYGNFLGISINTIGEKKWGIVQPGHEYESIIKEIIAQLETMKDPETGKNIATSIFRREDLYSGPHLTQSPDLTIQFSYDYQIVFRPLKKRIIERIKPARTGDHRREGIFIAHGPNIPQALLSRPIELADVTATLFALLDIPCPASYEGRVIHEVMSNDFKEFARSNEFDNLSLEADARQGGADEDFEKSKELLKNLGYM